MTLLITYPIKDALMKSKYMIVHFKASEIWDTDDVGMYINDVEFFLKCFLF
jgi:hypothetical protein